MSVGAALEETATSVEWRRAVEHLLQAARRHLDMEAAFLAEATDDELRWRVATEEAGSFTILEGGTLPRLESFCQHVLSRNAPWVVPDTSEDVVASELEVTTIGRLAAYIGVPVRLPDDRPFGTLCCISHAAQPHLGDRDVAVLQALADVLAFHVAQLRTSAEQRVALEARGGDLASQLRRQELRLGLLSQLVKAGRVPTLVLDPETLRIDYANDAAAALLGGSVDDILGEPVWQRADWMEDDLRGELQEVAVGTAPEARLEVPVPTGEQRLVLDVVVQRIATGADAGLLVTIHDITERRRSEERLERALEIERTAAEQLRHLDAMRNAFLTAVSHELRTPLTSVRLAAETLHNDRVRPELTATILDRLVANVDRLDRLLGDLLDLNQFAHGHLRLDRSVVRLDDLVRDAVAQVELGEHRFALDLQPLEARVAPTKYERIVVNLVLNATVHTAPCTITVRLARSGDQALLVVEDEGPGIDPDEGEVLFQPFRQGATAPAHRPGTGIGLSLVAAFAELHGGDAWIERATAGGGAAFHVAVPLDVDELATSDRA